MAIEKELTFDCRVAAQAQHPIRIDARDAFLIRRFIDDEPFRQTTPEPLRVMMEAMKDGALLLSPDGSVLHCNQSFAHMLRRPLGDVIGAPLATWVVDEHKDTFGRLLSESPLPSRTQVRLARSDGLCVPVEVAVSPMDVPGFSRALCVIVSDRTEHQLRLALEVEQQAARSRERILCERQQELEHLNLKLANANRGMADHCAELRDRAQQLERAGARKMRVLAHISHEFRSPLHSIFAVTSLLLRGSEGNSSGEQHQLLGYIRNAADALLGLVNDLLDQAKFAAGKLDVRSVEFAAVEMFGALRAMLPQSLLNPGVRLVFDDPADVPPLCSDQAKIAQIVRNLIDNGLKFTESGEVRVSADYDPVEDSVTFAVQDTGIGIAAEDHEKIFEEFVQLDNSAQPKIKGTGLGLSLCRSLATVLGGRISVQSERGGGAKFSLVLPRHYMPASKEKARDHELIQRERNDLQGDAEVLEYGNRERG